MRGGDAEAKLEVRWFVVEWRERLLMVTRRLHVGCTRGPLLFSNKASFSGRHKVLLNHLFSG